MKKRIISLIVMLCMICAMIPMYGYAADEVASGTCGENLTWVLDSEGTLTISGEGAMDDYYVEAPWYSYRSDIVSVMVENGVTSISSYAFYECSNLTNITISETVDSIGVLAIEDCPSLIGVWVAENNQYYSNDESGVLFNKDKTTIIRAPETISGNYVIPDSVVHIPRNVFCNCIYLTGVSIPSGVTSISQHAFAYCSNLTSVEIPNSVINVGERAFYDCTALTEVVLNVGIENIGESAFYNCRSLIRIVIPESVTSIDWGAFYGCTALTRIMFLGDAPEFEDEYTFHKAKTTAYYPANNDTWTTDVMESCGEDISWVAIGNLTGITVRDFPTKNYAVGDSLNLDDLKVAAVDEYGTQMPLAYDELTILDVDMSTVGAKTVTVCYEDFSTSFQIYVHAGKMDQVLDASTYPESTHNYEDSLDETQTISCNGAEYLILTFSEDTYTESNYDHIYVYDRSDNQIAKYSGSEAAGISITVSGDTAKIRLTSDVSVNGYGYAFTSISAYGVIHTGSTAAAGVAATCTEAGRTDGTACEICGEVFDCDIIPALGHDYVSVVTEATPEANGYTTHTCSRCNDSYVDSYTMYGAIAFGTCGDNLTWILSEDYVLTISGEGEMGDYDYDTRPWNEYIEEIVAIEISSGVTSICNDAFRWSEKLTSVVIPEGLISIGADAFEGCNSLTNVVIPDSVVSIGDEAFWGCENLESVTLSDSITTISESLFRYCCSLDNVIIPDGVTSIGSSAFNDCNGLTSITIPESVSTIGSFAFENADSLPTVTIPDSVTSIGNYAFAYCDSLSSITIPESVTNIGWNVFTDCDSLVGIYVDENNPNYSSDEYGVLFDKEKTYLIQAPGGISGEYTVPDGVTTIYDAFNYCDKLTIVTIPDSVTTLGSAFMYCGSLTNVTLPSSITSIESDTFYECRSLTSITIPEGVTSIGGTAFSKCYSLTSITIPAGVTSIGAAAFYKCWNLTSVTIPDGVASIENETFGNCSGLTNITIPASVVSIGDEAFWCCDSLSRVIFEGDAPTFGDSVFYEDTATAYYPADNETWTSDVMQDYGGTITWAAYYEILDGADSVVDAGNGEDLTIRAAGDISKFESVTVDGETVDPSNYTVTEGSTVVTFNAEYLETLDEGQHTVEIHFTDGMATTTVTVEKTYIPGDITGDGKVNNRDAARLMQYLAGWDVEYVEAALDVNGDGKINNRDAARLMQYLAGWDVEIN